MKPIGAAQRVTRMSVPLHWAPSSPLRPNESCFRGKSSSGTSRRPCGMHCQDSSRTRRFSCSTILPTRSISAMAKNFSSGTEKIWKIPAKVTTVGRRVLRFTCGISSRTGHDFELWNPYSPIVHFRTSFFVKQCYNSVNIAWQKNETRSHWTVVMSHNACNFLWQLGRIRR